jgi:osmoprotectant transport system permease protein
VRDGAFLRHRAPRPRWARVGWRAVRIFLLSAVVAAIAHAEDRLEVGSKRFTESYILAEMVVRAAGGEALATHKPGLGNTGILHPALRSGSIDV